MVYAKALVNKEFLIMSKTASVKHNAIKAGVGILLSILLFFSAGLEILKFDSQADTYFSEKNNRGRITV
jgi:hypothetical protein